LLSCTAQISDAYTYCSNTFVVMKSSRVQLIFNLTGMQSILPHMTAELPCVVVLHSRHKDLAQYILFITANVLLQ